MGCLISERGISLLVIVGKAYKVNPYKPFLLLSFPLLIDLLLFKRKVIEEGPSPDEEAAMPWKKQRRNREETIP